MKVQAVSLKKLPQTAMIWIAVEDVNTTQHIFISNWNKIWISLGLKWKLLASFTGPEFKIMFPSALVPFSWVLFTSNHLKWN